MPSALLAVDVDGDNHRRLTKQKALDRKKEEALLSRGYRVIRIPNENVEHDLEAVLGFITAVASRSAADQTARPCLLFQIETLWAYRVEHCVHQHYAESRIQGEWYRLTDEQIEAFPTVVGKFRPPHEQVRAFARHSAELERRYQERKRKQREISSPGPAAP